MDYDSVILKVGGFGAKVSPNVVIALKIEASDTTNKKVF
jgi:hypothetical protein